jgi:2-methylcitrate dehydratase PrpD
MTQIAHRLATHVTELPYDALPAEVVDKTKQLILDLLGVAIRASVDAESTPAIRRTVTALGSPGTSSLIGESTTASPSDAAFYNASLAHSLDFDDTQREGSVHPGAAIIPTVLALAEAGQRSGAEAILATVVGYDVTCRIAVALDPESHYARGFHPTATCGTFGATAAAARLRGLSAAELENAFGINGSQAAGSLQFLENGAWNKRIHPGLAARNAILAIALAEAGFRGASQPFDGRHGLLKAYSDRGRAEPLTEDLGRRFDVMTTAIKPYPACRYAHAPLDAIIEIARRHDLQPGEVDSIEIGLSDAGLALIGQPIERKREPENVVDAQFSMPFLAAVGLTRRRMGWSDYDALSDPVVRAVARKVVVTPDAEANQVFPGRWLASVTIEAKGERFVDRREARGEPEAPLTWSEVEDKFNELTEPVLGDRRAHVVDVVRSLDALPDVRTLGGLLRSQRELVASTRPGATNAP